MDTQKMATDRLKGPLEMRSCKFGHEVTPDQEKCSQCGTPTSGTCPMGHAVGALDMFCAVCGTAIYPPEPATGRSPQNHYQEGERPDVAKSRLPRAKSRYVLAGIPIVVAVGVWLWVSLSNGAATSSPTDEGGGLRTIECPVRIEDLPRGTDLVSVALVENSPDRIRLSALFDGPVPAAQDDARYTLALELLLFVDEQDQSPYRVFVSSIFGPYAAQAGRIGYGFIDSSGFDLSVNGDRMEVTFNPSVFTELPAGDPFPFGARTLVQELASGQGYVEAGAEPCAVK